ncbi:hypothetical protein [Actinoplanes couchii]|uniref:Plasmid replication, integration and excision activator n=1 Tax=Actinoplanes couchii TaxID=403638 RepID=A0ABQ3XQF7_9ACTN|nr:hypothetical protein [Actinoplanes couchii]MDR6322971.1 hypothetical protein [Actinoplanes couchii]GID60645.1 hypothetical protein Aco03nite_090490 [Actinoplanes couchii]
MAVPNALKVPVPFDYVFPSGALFLGVEAATDFDKRGQGDDQLRDKETGERVWVVRVLDLDPEAGKFGGSKELKVKVVAAQQPVPPTSAVPGYPPMVAFNDVMLTPYVDSQRCKSAATKCRSRLAWSVKASAMTTPEQTSRPKAA